MPYIGEVIKSFLHKGLGAFFRTGSKAGIQPAHATRLRLQLARLDTAVGAEDMDLPGWKLHALKGELKGHWAVWGRSKLAVAVHLRRRRCGSGGLPRLSLV